MDAIFGFLNNPIVLAAIGIVVKFVPGVRSFVSNSLIPAITVALAWISGLLGPAEAHAAAGPLAVLMPVTVFGLSGPLLGLGTALWQAGQSWILHEWILRRWLPSRPADSRQ